MAQFEHGNTYSTGRPKGVQNKKNAEITQRIKCFIECNFEEFQMLYDSLDISEKVKTFLTLLNYVAPKKQALSVDAQIESEYKQLEKLLNDTPAEYIDAIANKIIQLRGDSEETKILNL